jgi:hypothetical protein
MRIKTKLLVIEEDENGEIVSSYWDDFQFDMRQYGAHCEHEQGCLVYLTGLPYPFIIQLSFDELAVELDFLNNFETISLN